MEVALEVIARMRRLLVTCEIRRSRAGGLMANVREACWLVLYMLHEEASRGSRGNGERDVCLKPCGDV